MERRHDTIVSAELCDVNDTTNYPNAAVTFPAKPENARVTDVDFYDIIEDFFQDDSGGFDFYDGGEDFETPVAMPVMDICEDASVQTIPASPLPCFQYPYSLRELDNVRYAPAAAAAAMQHVDLKPVAKPIQYSTPAYGIEVKAIEEKPQYSHLQPQQAPHNYAGNVTAPTRMRFPIASVYPSKPLNREEKRAIRHKAISRWRHKIAKAKHKKALGEVPTAANARKVAASKRVRENGRFKKVSTNWISVSEFQSKCDLSGSGQYKDDEVARLQDLTLEDGLKHAVGDADGKGQLTFEYDEAII